MKSLYWKDSIKELDDQYVESSKIWEEHTPVIELDSTGGNINTAMRVCGIIRRKPKSVIVNSATCSSAALTLLVGAKLENRWAYNDSLFMIHGSGHPAATARTVEWLVARTRLPRQFVQDFMTEDGVWFTAVEALEYGVIGNIIDKITFERIDTVP